MIKVLIQYSLCYRHTKCVWVCGEKRKRTILRYIEINIGTYGKFTFRYFLAKLFAHCCCCCYMFVQSFIAFLYEIFRVDNSNGLGNIYASYVSIVDFTTLSVWWFCGDVLLSVILPRWLLSSSAYITYSSVIYI